MNPDWMPGAYG